MSEDRVTIADCRSRGLCISGVKEFCALNSIDFKRLIREGIPTTELMHIDDVNLKRVLEDKEGS